MQQKLQPPDLEPDSASGHAREMLRALGVSDASIPETRDLDPALEWAGSGAMALTGNLEGAPRLAPGALATSARAAAYALAALAPGHATLANLDGPALLGERAALLGLTRRGAIAPGGSCRLLAARDGWLAVNLPREEDREMLPAWLENEPNSGEDLWEYATRSLTSKALHGIVDRAHCLGLAVARAHPLPPAPTPWFTIAERGLAVSRPMQESPLVLDLSSLWAGPLCTQLLTLAGARVIKVESEHRPDGARRGSPEFFDLLNFGKQSVVLDFSDQAGLGQLRELIARADIVVESARPRALGQLGIDATEWVRNRPGLTWVSITAYGRGDPQGHWVGFGDDVAVAAGATIPPDENAFAPTFCGDAIADPLTGLHAAVAALATHLGGHGGLLDLSLHGVTAHSLARAQKPIARVEKSPLGATSEHENWCVVSPAGKNFVARPRARRARGRAPALGADNRRVLADASLKSLSRRGI